MQERQKRILIFSTAYYPFVGGAEVAVKEITDRLSSNFEFDLITAKLDKKLKNFEKVGCVNVYRLGVGIPFLDKIFLPITGAILALKLSRSKKYFCIWGIMVTFASGAGYIFNILGPLVGERKVPMVLTLQEGDSESYLNYKWAGLIALSWKMALKRTNILSAISNFLLNRAKKNGFDGYGVVVPNGVDVSVFSKEIDPDITKRIKVQLGKLDNDVFLVTTSRLTVKNGLSSVISALPLLPERFHFIIIGKGEEGGRLQELANKLGVKNRVKFLGFIPYKDIPSYFSACDIFIRPSLSEGFGNSFIEAMAFGLPVIATPVGGIVDFISDKETGFFCSTENPQSIVRAIEVISDSQLKDRVIQSAKTLAIDKYSWDKVAKDMKETVFDYVAQL